ncbi:MAG TPA: CHAT domain-containing tetratricopeptide repeat protein [Pyrinomonadaceae bacterium]|nr:CHAT domain-containing tetratricopeptide repeat protein [Pyrinomonadaceae bacterium]
MNTKVPKIAHLIVIASLLFTFPTAALQARVSEGTSPPQQPDQAGVAFEQGKRLLRRGHADQALVQLQNALNLYTAAKNDRGVAKANNEIGDLYLRQGQFQVALDHYKKALDGFVGEDKKNQQATAAASMVDSRLANANIADDKFNANLMLAKIGDVNFRLKRIPEALAAYGQMEVKKPEAPAAKGLRRFGGIGAIIGGASSGNAGVGTSTSLATVAIEAKKELDDYRNSIVYASYQVGMGRISYANNDLDGAKKYFQAARDASKVTIAGIANLGQTRRFRAAARTSLGDVALRQGKLKEAKDSYDEAIKGAKDDKRLDLTWPAQRGLGRTMWLQAAQEKDPNKATSMRESAIASYRDAIKTIETLREGSLRADEARTTFLASTKDVFDEGAAGLSEMALLAGTTPGAPLSGKALEYAAEAFRITEESRARSLLDLLGEIGGTITEGVPADLLKRKQENLDRQQEIAEILTGVNISTDEQKKKPSELDAELEKLQTDYEALENQIRTASPRYAALSSNQPLTLADVQQRVLDDQTVLLEYSLGSEASYMWAVGKNAVSLYKLPDKATIDKLATDLRGQLIPAKLQRRIVGIDVASDQQRGLGIAAAGSQDVSPFAAASRALYKAVVEPAAALIGEKRLLLVPDGALNYVPFEVLVKQAEGNDFSALQYLIKSNEIVYAPSASVVAAIRQQRTKPTGRAMLIVADPVFNSNDPRAGKATTPTETAETRGLGIDSALTDVTGQSVAGSAQSQKMQGLPLARLTGTRIEAQQISALAKSSGGQTDVWLDLEASEDNITARDMSKYRALHIATHGLLNAERPQFTGVVLSLVGNHNSDGFLRTDEVFNLHLGSPLVMLSACETGLGREKRGEGVMGLTRAFMYAGAPTVGVSLWSVADKSTADLMTDFYKRLFAADNVSPSAAMRDAQLAMIGGKKFSAPFYWAPFVLVGDWQ